MKLTTKGRYAGMALADLARFDSVGPVSLRDVSLRQGISLLYLEQIFSRLKKNNIVKSTRGVNGGYIDNPYVKFGVNCYGKKPTPTENDRKRFETQQSHPIPLTAEDKELQEKIEYWKKNPEKLQLNSFNNNNWSRY